MTEKKLKETEKSPIIISFNSKEESLLKKKILSIDLMKKQAADSLTLDQKLLYNHFILRLRRSELAHARLMGNRELMKQLAHTMFSSFNTTLNDGSEKAVKAMLQNGKPTRAVSAPCRPNPWMSGDSKTHRTEVNKGHNIRALSARIENTPSTPQRFYSAPGRRKTLNQQAQVTFFEPTVPNNLDVAVQPELPKFKAEKQARDMTFSQSNGNLVRKRPKSTSFLLDSRGTKLRDQHDSMTGTDETEEMFSRKVKTFIEKVKSLQQSDPTLKDYYSERMHHETGKKDIFSLTYKDDEKEHNQWLPTGDELYHRSVTLKKLDTNFSHKDVPSDILFMEQYNLVLTKENYSVRNWINNNPYLSTK